MPTGWVTQDNYWSPCPGRAHHQHLVRFPLKPHLAPLLPVSPTSEASEGLGSRGVGVGGGSWSSHLINHKWDGAGETVGGWGRRQGGISHWCVSFITKKEQPMKLRVDHLVQRFSVLFLGF